MRITDQGWYPSGKRHPREETRIGSPGRLHTVSVPGGPRHRRDSGCHLNLAAPFSRLLLSLNRSEARTKRLSRATDTVTVLIEAGH
eukprot:768766-Hanusia_phi.AAC.15